jgi:hypothetical protein
LKINSNVFKDRKILIVTKHHKEKVIAPLLENELGLRCFTSEKFDTDSLGTFSGEIPRKNDPLTTLRQKCQLAMEIEGFELAIATEGSFGNHPSIFFAAANDELILFYDQKNNIEIVERVLSLNTNFNESRIESRPQLEDFLHKVQFPSHGVILKDTKDNPTFIQKGIASWEQLEQYYAVFAAENKAFHIETDMRALYNPTRMAVIEEACQKLIKKIQTACPNCQTPGFGIVNAEEGLPCEWCAQPTRSTLAHVYECKNCNHQERAYFPNQKKTEDPMYCDFCNP